MKSTLTLTMSCVSDALKNHSSWISSFLMMSYKIVKESQPIYTVTQKPRTTGHSGTEVK